MAALKFAFGDAGRILRRELDELMRALGTLCPTLKDEVSRIELFSSLCRFNLSPSVIYWLPVRSPLLYGLA